MGSWKESLGICNSLHKQFLFPPFNGVKNPLFCPSVLFPVQEIFSRIICKFTRQNLIIFFVHGLGFHIVEHEMIGFQIIRRKQSESRITDSWEVGANVNLSFCVLVVTDSWEVGANVNLSFCVLVAHHCS